MLDTSFFKKLAHNDTGSAAGHQGGIVIPKDISEFFPPLAEVSDAVGPTASARLTAKLFVDGRPVGTVTTRYQHQTWGRTRSPERRLTDNLGALRNQASADDFILFTKDLSNDAYIRLNLVRKGTVEHSRIDALAGSRRWGLLDPANPPVSLRQISEAEDYVEQAATGPASAFADERQTLETLTLRRARDRAFRKKLLDQYDHRCAFTGRSFVSPGPGRVFGLDGAHVIPVAACGSDHPANGLALTKDLHWAFDTGLIGVAEDRTILVPACVSDLPGNEFLFNLHGSPLREARDPGLRVLEVALKWHRQNILVGS